MAVEVVEAEAVASEEVVIEVVAEAEASEVVVIEVVAVEAAEDSVIAAEEAVVVASEVIEDPQDNHLTSYNSKVPEPCCDQFFEG